MKAVKKAYEINRNRIDEGYLYSPMVVYAESLNKAKSLLLSKYRHEIVVKKTDEEPTYITIPVIRAKEYDKFMFDGKEMNKYEIEEHKRDLERKQYLDSILNDNTIKYCYIKKNGYYYCSNYNGYSERVSWAGVYTKEEAVGEAKSVREISIYPININEHNEMIKKEIERLNTKLITI